MVPWISIKQDNVVIKKTILQFSLSSWCEIQSFVLVFEHFGGFDSKSGLWLLLKIGTADAAPFVLAGVCGTRCAKAVRWVIAIFSRL